MAPRAVVRIGTTTALIQDDQQISGLAQKIEFREPPLIRPIEFRERPDCQMKGIKPVYEALKETDKSKRRPSAVGSVSPQSTASSSSRQGSANMTKTHQVLFILKTRYQNPHDRISHIGGLNSDGTPWNLTLASAVDAIERSRWKFYLMRNGTSFDLIVATTRLGNKYLKTTADRQQPIGLLALPACAVTVVASATPASGTSVCQCESSC